MIVLSQTRQFVKPGFTGGEVEAEYACGRNIPATVPAALPCLLQIENLFNPLQPKRQKDLFPTSRFWYITQRIIIDDLFAITIIS
ncbi:MAG: hypothetical protein IJM24_01585 [Clostridia bacterium]|nr:hypothetical protein [Clostridia bacterium]